VVVLQKYQKRNGAFQMSTILLVDDDPHLRELARVFLQQEGFAVSEAADGVEALSILERLKVEL